VDWLIYAFGGGWGHLTRAVALARAAPPHCRVRILTNSPYASAISGEFDIVARAKVADPDCLIADCLIVDTFPRGLGGELVDPLRSFSGVKVLVARDLNPQYAIAFGLEDFIRSSYDLVLSPGDMGPGHVTAPWLVRSPDELLPRDTARALLSLNDERPCVVVCAAGNREELAWYGAVAGHLLALNLPINVRLIAAVCPPRCPPECWLSYWPAIELYNAADVVVGGAGYNTVYECLACGVPLIARPWARKYDRQWLRARRAGVTIVETPEQAAAAAVRMLSAGPERCIGFENGVEEAVALITRAVAQPGVHTHAPIAVDLYPSG
jgi:hypothetical protein